LYSHRLPNAGDVRWNLPSFLQEMEVILMKTKNNLSYYRQPQKKTLVKILYLIVFARFLSLLKLILILLSETI